MPLQWSWGLNGYIESCRNPFPLASTLGNRGCFSVPWDTHGHPTREESAAYLACLEVCSFVGGANRSELSCAQNAVDRAHNNGWPEGEQYATLLRDRYRLKDAIEELCGAGAQTTAKTAGNHPADARPKGATSTAMSGVAPSGSGKTDGDLLSCDDVNDLLRPGVAAFILYVILLALGVPPSALASLEVSILLTFGTAVSRGCLR